MRNVYCNPSDMPDYIEHYAKQSKPFATFWRIVSRDFNPLFLIRNHKLIENKYNFQLDINQLRNVKYGNL